ncbi:MAG TPA: hypothetical protein VGL86_26250, partial [Polyangia bacterium]
MVTSALSLFVLERALSTSMQVRRGRARDIVSTEVDRLAATRPSGAALEAGSSAFVGVRGGWVDDPADVARAPSVPAAWAPTMVDTLSRAATTHAHVVGELEQPPNTLIVAAAPAQTGLAWAAYLVMPLKALQTWRLITIGLAFATVLLVITAVWA